MTGRESRGAVRGNVTVFIFFCLTGGGDLVNFYFVKTHPAVHFLFGHFEV